MSESEATTLVPTEPLPTTITDVERVPAQSGSEKLAATPDSDNDYDDGNATLTPRTALRNQLLHQVSIQLHAAVSALLHSNVG